MSWEDLREFKDKGRRFGNVFATITSRKSILLSSGLVHELGEEIKNNEFVRLLYSPSNRAIVMDFINDEKDPSAIKLSKGTNVQIAAGSFMNYYNLEPQNLAGRYSPKQEDIPGRGKKWVIFLNEKEGNEIKD
ncbi:MAG: hypothetical protein VKK42_32280 [Lyngbya sp.]|nr:hypothetical protein [Lyngbya sp.]